MILSSEQLVKILVAEGFIFKRSKGSHQVYFNPTSKITVVVPMHGKSLKKGTAIGILKQAQIILKTGNKN